jgi:hypothetical protein
MTSFCGVDFPREWTEDHPEWTRNELGIYYNKIHSHHTDNDYSADIYLFRLDFWSGNRPVSFSIDIFRDYLDGRDEFDRTSKGDIKALDERMDIG